VSNPPTLLCTCHTFSCSISTNRNRHPCCVINYRIANLRAIQSQVSAHLLEKLQLTQDDTVWDECPELLVWLLHIGGTFTRTEAVRSGYIDLIRLNANSRFRGLYQSWSDVREILSKFIWSEKAFMPYVKEFWEITVV
jgi:hypothetical protein